MALAMPTLGVAEGGPVPIPPPRPEPGPAGASGSPTAWSRGASDGGASILISSSGSPSVETSAELMLATAVWTSLEKVAAPRSDRITTCTRNETAQAGRSNRRRRARRRLFARTAAVSAFGGGRRPEACRGPQRVAARGGRGRTASPGGGDGPEVVRGSRPGRTKGRKRAGP